MVSRVGMAVIVEEDGMLVAMMFQFTPLLVEMEIVMLVVPAAVPLNVRAYMSTVRLVKLTVEKAGDVMDDEDWSICT